MRFKKAPLRSTCGNNKSDSNTSEEKRQSTNTTKMSSTDEEFSSKKKLRILPSHVLQGGGGGGASGNGFEGIFASFSSSQRKSGSFISKDEETQAAQAKLRQYEALGHIKVEVDETGEEENCHVPVSEEHTTLMQSPGGHPVSNSQPSNQYQMQNINGNIIAPLFTLVQPSPPAPMSQQQKGSGVVDVPALTDMEGDYGFNVTIEEKERTTKSPMWLMSKITSKLYTNINKAVPFEIHLKKKVPRDEFRIRAFAVFSSAQFLRTNVVRCPNHASTTDITNHDFPFPGHVVRADHPEAKYEESSNGRLSVVVPLDILQDGSDFTPILLRFMCLGSCVGGINRRPIAIILTLENRSGHVCGRKVIDVRVCACPTRDIRTDEQTLMNKGKRRGSSLQDKTTAPLRKKPKNVEPKVEPDDDDKTFYIPVKGKRLYDFMMMMKKNYYACHPEYAAKYPDDTRFQNDDSDDDLIGLQGLRLESEAVTWDSGGTYSHRVKLNNECQVDTVTCPKNNSPLSKLTPKISITPSDHDLRLWPEDDENDIINCTQSEVEYQHIIKEDDIHCSQNNSLNSDSISRSKPTVVMSRVVKKIDNISKHVPVMQLPSYKSSQVSVKNKLPVISRQNQFNYNGEERDRKDFSKRISHPAAKRLHYDSPNDQVLEHTISEDYLSPGSPEMLAANVLAEGFKAKAQ